MERSVFSDKMVFVESVHEKGWMSDLEFSLFNSWYEPMVQVRAKSAAPINSVMRAAYHDIFSSAASTFSHIRYAGLTKFGSRWVYLPANIS